ncbi:MAG: site-specific recombinase, partial [Sorangium cellulosum]
MPYVGYLEQSMDLHAWVDAFLDHLRIERALTRNTVESYSRDLSKLLDLAEREGVDEVRQMNLSFISMYLVDLGDRGLGARSAARHLSAVRGF